MAVKNCFIRGSVVRYVQLPSEHVDTQLLEDATRRGTSLYVFHPSLLCGRTAAMDDADYYCRLYRIGQPGQTMILAYRLNPAVIAFRFLSLHWLLALRYLHDALNTNRHCTTISHHALITSQEDKLNILIYKYTAVGLSGTRVWVSPDFYRAVRTGSDHLPSLVWVVFRPSDDLVVHFWWWVGLEWI